MKSYLDIILAPIITEKTAGMEPESKYAFKVANSANKTEIKQAIEKKFNVKVMAVNITNSHPKKKRVGKYTGMTSKYKKAIVTLKKGDTISFD
ncbi:MAG: 50S ribosomal protein L23 [Bacilli bacterium]